VVRGLLRMNRSSVFRTEPQKIWQFCSYIDFSLPHVLAGAKHRRSAHLRAARAADNVSRLERDCNSVFQAQILPVSARFQCPADCIMVLQEQ
jgi:hypothetical protein